MSALPSKRMTREQLEAEAIRLDQEEQERKEAERKFIATELSRQKRIEETKKQKRIIALDLREQSDIYGDRPNTTRIRLADAAGNSNIKMLSITPGNLMGPGAFVEWVEDKGDLANLTDRKREYFYCFIPATHIKKVTLDTSPAPEPEPKDDGKS